MNHRFEQQRRGAAEAFLESLDQMSRCFQSETEEPAEVKLATPAAESAHAAEPFDLDALEAAIADIEQFMQQRQS